MHPTHFRLEQILDSTIPKLNLITEEKASLKPAPGKWSNKELIGHLIDSASNNHQRFVRMQLENDLNLLQYEQDGWVRVQDYQNRSWKEIVLFWEVYNRHLVHVLKRMNPSTLENTATFPSYGVKTLKWMADDYVDHLVHHLKQIT